MTRLFNDPTDFADEALAGFVAAHRISVRAVPGGVVRRKPAPPGQVAVVVGGGSGHYPAFSGLVGPGLAHGAAVGNVFASPSAQQIYQVARAAQTGGGVLLAYGNYAGDELHFSQAQERLEADGIPTRRLAVTDDISSAGPKEIHRRRGVAGDLAVFKVVGAAAHDGSSLDEVARLGELANARTRSFGIAFSGCTLPGATHPLFTVASDRMAIGLGIHGEPGIGEGPVPTADGAAELMVDKLLDNCPAGQVPQRRVGLILNGLGTIKYEELFVVYRRVAEMLARADIDIVEPEVGELVTSFDMAGLSLTLLWLDETLEPLWRAPADSAAYRKVFADTDIDDISDPVDTESETPAPNASVASRKAARTVLAALEAVRTTIDLHVEELGDLDAVAGDGDHGIGMQRGARAGYRAAVDSANRGSGAGTVLADAAHAWSNKSGGTSGALWGVILKSVGDVVGDYETPTPQDIASGISNAAQDVMRIGKAELGDKTMVDALVPFADTLRDVSNSAASLADSWTAAATVADAAARATADLLPRMGRARPHAERSLGTPDPGAHSFALITLAIRDILAASVGDVNTKTSAAQIDQPT